MYHGQRRGRIDLGNFLRVAGLARKLDFEAVTGEDSGGVHQSISLRVR